MTELSVLITEHLRQPFAWLAWSLCWITFCAHHLTAVLTHRQVRPDRAYRTVILASLVVLWCPIPGIGYNLMAYLQGLLFTPSIALLLISISATLTHWQDASGCRRAPTLFNRWALWPWLLGLAVVFYPPALGVGMWDPYRWGYMPSFTLVLAAANLALWTLSNRFTSAHTLALWITLSLLAHLLSLYESTNLWDILFDPFAAIWAITAGVRFAGREKRRAGKKHQQIASPAP